MSNPLDPTTVILLYSAVQFCALSFVMMESRLQSSDQSESDQGIHPLSKKNQNHLSDGSFRRDNKQPHVAPCTRSLVRWDNSIGSSRWQLGGLHTSKSMSLSESRAVPLRRNSAMVGSSRPMEPLNLSVVKCVTIFIDQLTSLSTDRFFSLGNPP